MLNTHIPLVGLGWLDIDALCIDVVERGLDISVSTRL